jgi:hypothetical protein
MMSTRMTAAPTDVTLLRGPAWIKDRVQAWAGMVELSFAAACRVLIVVALRHLDPNDANARAADPVTEGDDANERADALRFSPELKDKIAQYAEWTGLGSTVAGMRVLILNGLDILDPDDPPSKSGVEDGCTACGGPIHLCHCGQPISHQEWVDTMLCRACAHNVAAAAGMLLPAAAETLVTPATTSRVVLDVREDDER